MMRPWLQYASLLMLRTPAGSDHETPWIRGQVMAIKQPTTQYACRQCGVEIEQKPGVGRLRRYCSRACQARYRRASLPRKERKPRERRRHECQHCHVLYVPKNSTRKSFCSRECSFAKMRERRLTREEATRLPLLERPCSVCGSRFLSRRIARKFCSDHCRDEEARRYAMRLYYERRPTDPYPPRPCLVCGVVFAVPRQRGKSSRQVYCSPLCGRRAARKRVALSRRMEQRAREKVVRAGDKIDPVRVFARDDWTCWICHCPCDRQAEVPALLAAVLDHVVPISSGGPHTYDNVRCAHFICNSHKGAGDAEKVRHACERVVEGLRLA